MAMKDFSSPVYQAMVIMQAGQAFGESRRSHPSEGQEFLVGLQARGTLNRNGHVFQDRKGLLSIYERWFQRASQAVGLGEQNHTPHDLRSANTNEEYTRYRQAGMPKRQAEQKISQRLGHQRLEVLKRYLAPGILNSDNYEVHNEEELTKCRLS